MCNYSAAPYISELVSLVMNCEKIPLAIKNTMGVKMLQIHDKINAPFCSICEQMSLRLLHVSSTNFLGLLSFPSYVVLQKAKLIQKFPSVMLWWLETFNWVWIKKIIPVSRVQLHRRHREHTQRAHSHLLLVLSLMRWEKIDQRCMGYCAEKYEELESLAWWCAFRHYANVLRTRLAADRSRNMQIGHKHLPFNS